MSEWTLNGNKEIGPFLESLGSPQDMAHELWDYRQNLGEDFTIEMLIKLYEIQSRALLAKAIYDLPEFTMDQLFKAFNAGETLKVDVSARVDGDMEIRKFELL